MSRNTPEMTEPAAIYALAAQTPGGSIVVKIGLTGVPYERYAALITGVPFPSVMKWTWVGIRAAAHVIESNLHRQFAERNTAREWFLFQPHEGKLLWDGISAAIYDRTGCLPDWKTITEEQVAAFCQAKAKPKRKGKKGYRETDLKNRLKRHERVF